MRPSRIDFQDALSISHLPLGAHHHAIIQQAIQSPAGEKRRGQLHGGEVGKEGRDPHIAPLILRRVGEVGVDVLGHDVSIKHERKVKVADLGEETAQIEAAGDSRQHFRSLSHSQRNEREEKKRKNKRELERKDSRPKIQHKPLKPKPRPRLQQPKTSNRAQMRARTIPTHDNQGRPKIPLRKIHQVLPDIETVLVARRVRVLRRKPISDRHDFKTAAVRKVLQ